MSGAVSPIDCKACREGEYYPELSFEHENTWLVV
jgi:hypothetical protein